MYFIWLFFKHRKAWVVPKAKIPITQSLSTNLSTEFVYRLVSSETIPFDRFLKARNAVFLLRWCLHFFHAILSMSAHELHLLSRAKMFNGHQEQYCCFSETCQTDMTFGIYLPPQVLKGYPAPVLYFLSGLHGDGSELIRQRLFWSGSVFVGKHWHL